MMKDVVLVGCGPVARQYLRSFEVMPDMYLTGVHDPDPALRDALAARASRPALADMAAVKQAAEAGVVVLNLLDLPLRAALTQEMIEAGHAVWSEWPPAPTYAMTHALHDLATEKGVPFASAPTTPLSEAAQALGRALRGRIAGHVLTVQAEMDAGFGQDGGTLLDQVSPWLSWLIALFGPVRKVTAATAALRDEDRLDHASATLFFHSGLTAQLTCSALGPRRRRLRVQGSTGVLTVPDCFDNAARVTMRDRKLLRGGLLGWPLRRRVVVSDVPHPQVPPQNGQAMNLALGPDEMCDAIAAEDVPRLGGDYMLHLAEVAFAIAGAGDGIAQEMETTCEVMRPLPWAL